MSRWMALSAMLLWGCGEGTQAPEGPPPERFDASLQLAPASVAPGQSVSMNFEMNHEGEAPVSVDVELQVLGNGEMPEHQYRWYGVVFRPRDNWSISHAFLTSTDAQVEPYRIRLTLRSITTGEAFYDNPHLGEFVVARGKGGPSPK